jgi:hypothetical protein
MNDDAVREQAIWKAEEAIHAAEALAMADPRRPRYHFRARSQ